MHRDACCKPLANCTVNDPYLTSSTSPKHDAHEVWSLSMYLLLTSTAELKQYFLKFYVFKTLQKIYWGFLSAVFIDKLNVHDKYNSVFSFSYNKKQPKCFHNMLLVFNLVNMKYLKNVPKSQLFEVFFRLIEKKVLALFQHTCIFQLKCSNDQPLLGVQRTSLNIKVFQS